MAAGYHYGVKLRITPTGLSPASAAASLAALPPLVYTTEPVQEHCRFRFCAPGITLPRALHDAGRSHAIAAWGSIEGERVRLGLRGADVPAPVRVRRSVAYGRVPGREGCCRESRPVGALARRVRAQGWAEAGHPPLTTSPCSRTTGA